MNYYIDTEFIEDFTNPYLEVLNWFRLIRPKHYIDLISIGIVAEDGREYYAVNKEFDLKHVWNKYDLHLPDQIGDEPKKVYWLRENVLRPIWEDLRKKVSGFQKDHTTAHEEFTYRNLKTLIQWYGKTRAQISQEIQCFTAGVMYMKERNIWTNMDVVKDLNSKGGIDFYGYYCDYDWVVFCSLFGRMLDLPKGYPMYCRDLKQMMDECRLTKEWKNQVVPGDNEHHALADARWNKKLHHAIQADGVFSHSPIAKQSL